MTKEKTIKQFIKENLELFKKTMSCEYADSNPNMERKDMHHYKVTIKRRFKVFGNYLDSRYGFKQMTLHL